MNGHSFQKPLKLSDLMKGTTFELTSRTPDVEEDEDSLFWDEDQDPDKYKNPCATSFTDWKTHMVEVSEGVFKKVQKQPAEDAKEVELNRHRISYHRNMYLEGEDHPFDSTYLNGKSDEVCLPLKKDEYLEGFLDALASMKEGEQSLFVISYKKMFKELGCPPRIQPKADILCDLKVVKVEEVGDQEIIDKLNTQEGTKFSDVKESLEEVRLRASDLFSMRKMDSAIKLYHRILQAANFSVTCNEQEEKARNDILTRTHTNLAVCSNKKGDYSDTLYHVRNLEVLGGIDDQPKILYNKGIALMKLGEYNDAVDPLTKALKLRPLDKQIVEAVEELDRRKKAYDEERQTFGKNLGFR